MSDAGFLNFDASEFVVLEDAIEFDETVQREGAVRFYTLQEQEVDAFEQMIPKGRVSQFQRDQLQNELSRMHDLYEEYIVPTDEDYLLREPKIGTNLFWVSPVYATGERRPYDFSANWAPLHTKENKRVPNYYTRMITALPHPFVDTQEGSPYSLTTVTNFVNQEGGSQIRALPIYEATKTVVHEDKTTSIVPLPIAGSGDIVPFVGYFLAKRPLEIPNPLPEHPFLSENKPTFVPTTAPLADVIPSLDALLTHAIPTTNDPYRQASPYMKLYDIRMESIPWATWKSRFPAPEVAPLVERQLLEYPTAESQAPSQKILDGYKAQYAPGISAREWLLRQDDGGDFVIRALQSVAIDNGSVESVPGIDLPIPGYPATTVEECALTGLPFQGFVTKGLLRRSWKIEKDKDVIKLECVPLEFVKQERARSGYLGRRPWKETTGTELLETHLRALRQVRAILDQSGTSAPILRTPSTPESPARLNAVAILQDLRRHPLDKRRDLQELMKDMVLDKERYLDPNGAFVLCSHTLAILSGEFEADRRAFSDKWTVSVDGFRVCKVCGETITVAEFVDQDEFNEDGFVIRRQDVLDGTPAIESEFMQAYIEELQKIRPQFDASNPVDAMCYVILSLLQVLPSKEVVDTYLKIGRKAGASLGKKDDDQILRYKGTLGLALAALLLQSHVPILVPRRSFGSGALKLDGYPRDQAEPESFSIVDSLMAVVESTFRAYPIALSGPTRPVIRAILTSPKEVRKNALLFLKSKLLTEPGVREQLDKAKVAYAENPPPTRPVLLPAIPPPPLGTVRQYPECPGLRPVLEGKNPPRIRQPPIVLRTGLQAAKSRVEIKQAVSLRVVPADVPKTDIQRRIAIKPQITVADPYRTNLAIASRISDLSLAPLPVRTINPTQKPAELRDIARGLVFEASARSQLPLDELLKKDVALFSLTADFKKQKAEAQAIRATERLDYVKRMKDLSDQEREVNMELAKLGMAPIMITLEERKAFARKVEEEETGVGLPQDFGDQGESNAAGADNGNYGDYFAAPSSDGRDYVEPSLLDDFQTSI